MNTKLHAVTDASGRPISFFITAGQSAITPVLPPCLMNFPRPNGCWPTVAMMPTGIVTLYRRRITPCIRVENPARRPSNTTNAAKRRNRIEIMFGRLKDWRRVATRYDRCPMAFLSAIARCDRYLLAMSTLAHIKPEEPEVLGLSPHGTPVLSAACPTRSSRRQCRSIVRIVACGIDCSYVEVWR